MVAFRKPLAASTATDSPSGGTATLSNGHLNHPIRSSHRACIENLSAEAQDGGTESARTRLADNTAESSTMQ